MKFKLRARKNRYELIIESLKAEIYDKDKEIERLKEQLKQETQVMNKIKKLPTAKKHELGIL